MSRSFVLFVVLLGLLLVPGLQADEEGFVPLFDGKTLSGWTGDVKGYAVVDGTIVCKGRHLYTEKSYANFILRLEFKVPPGGNNGIGLRTPKGGHASRDGMEIQILDDDAPRYAKLKPGQYCGSIYNVVPAERGHLKKAGEWNTMEIVCNGSLVTVKLNGHVITKGDLSKFTKGGKRKNLARTEGHILFCGHGSPVAFRNLRIKVLD